MTKQPDAVIEQDPNNQVPRPILAKAIVQASAALEKLLASGLNRRAIIVLLMHSTRQGYKDIEYLLNALEQLAHDYTDPKR